MINFRPLMGGVALLLILPACPHNYPPPTDQVTDPVTLLEAMGAARADIKTARFKRMRLDYFGDKGRLSVRQLILVGAPDKLRIQTYIPGFDGVAGVLACECGRFAYHDRRENVYYHGPATAKNIARVLPVGLSCADLGSMLLGDAPRQTLVTAGGAPTIRWDIRTGRYALEVPIVGSKDGKIEVQVRHGDWTVAGVSRTTAGEAQFTYTAEDFETVDGHVFPDKRRFVVDGSGDDFSVTGLDIQVNPELPETLFGLAPPGGTKVVFVGAGPSPPPPGDRFCGSAE